MTTNITISSYVSTITDEQFRNMLNELDTPDEVQVNVSLLSIQTQHGNGYGTWKLVCRFEIDGQTVTLSSTTHNEELVLASSGADYRTFDYTQEQADALIVEQVLSDNMDRFLVEPKTASDED